MKEWLYCIDERENYSVGHRMRSEAHSSSPVRTNHATSDVSLQAPGDLLTRVAL